jgi:hypothetical protein
MKQIISLKVPAEPKAESVSHGNFNADLTPGETIETTDERIAFWLVSEYGLKEVGREEVKTEEPAAETQTAAEPAAEDLADGYPEDLPGRDALIAAEVPLSTAKTLSAEQLAEYKGIGPKTAESIVEYFAVGGTE